MTEKHPGNQPPPLPQAAAPPRPAPRTSNFKWIIVVVLAAFCVLVVCTVGLAFVAAAVESSDLDLAADGHEMRFKEVHIEGDKGLKDKILVLPIRGVILDQEGDLGSAGTTVNRVRGMLRKARKDDEVKALLLDINSPGGGVTASDIIYHELKRFRTETNKPIVAHFGDVAASGGYYVAMAADHVIARRTSVTGSIGVISHFLIWADLLEKVGVEVETIKSLNSQGQESFKDIGSSFRKMTDSERALLQVIITQMWQRFVEVVAEGRKGKLASGQIKKLADGRIFTGPQALELKLVDGIGYRETAFAKARELAGLSDARVVGLKRIQSFGDLFAELRSNTRGADLLDGVREVALGGPRLMYLWTGR